MPVVLGIDSSLTATGLCRIDVGGAYFDPSVWSGQCATVGAPPPTKDKSHRAMARRVNALVEVIEAAILDGIEGGKVDLIVLEALAFGARGAGVWVLPWLFGRIIELAERHDVPLIVVGTSQIKKYATGKGNADKDTTLLAVMKRWPEFEAKNNNETDATAAAVIGCHWLGYPLGEPTAYQIDVLDKISS